VVTYNLHLESKGDDRLRCAQLGEVLRDAQQYKAGEAAVICGDFNLNASNGPAADALNRASFGDALANRHAPTKPHSLFDQGKVIDWIFARKPMRPIRGQVQDSGSASDHYPLSADLAFA
jgi:endonuclease/exonuclease/phosphatase family metal-dependent hydrolase